MIHPGLLPPIVFLAFNFVNAAPTKTGFVIGAPHGGYDQYTDTITRALGRELRWGWVTATGYRSVPYRQWFDVNRPTERRYVGNGRFGQPRYTARGRQVYDGYQSRLQRAAHPADPDASVQLLVEIHGHSRSVATSDGYELRVDAIEVASSGFTIAELRRLQRRYDALVEELPYDLRVPLVIDRLDRWFDLEGYQVPFFFTAFGAKRNGSMQPHLAGRSLHFELPALLRETSWSRRNCAWILAELLRELE